MRESGGMIVLKGLIDNALAEYLRCVGVLSSGIRRFNWFAVTNPSFSSRGAFVRERRRGGLDANEWRYFCNVFRVLLIVYLFISAMKFAGNTTGDEDEDDDDDDGDGGDEAIAIARAPLL